MSGGRSDSPWPSRSSVTTLLPRSASARASGLVHALGEQQAVDQHEARGPSP